MSRARKNVKFTKEWRKNLGIASKRKWKNKEFRKKISNIKYHKHHIDLNLKNNKRNNFLVLTKSSHSYIHKKGYLYLVLTGQINNYIKWFKKSQWYKGEDKINKKHKLIIKCLNDCQAECSCGGWYYCGIGEKTKKEIREEFKKHLEQYREV